MSELQQQSPPSPLRILVLGAGGTGGYFGGRLAASGADLCFLVRETRAKQLAAQGLVIQSPLGDAHIPVRTVLASDLADQSFDLIVLSCKAYDLESALKAITPAMTGDCSVLPILNGLLHYDLLDTHFGRANVLGGLCLISATKREDGTIVHFNGLAKITFGVRDKSERQAALVSALANTCKAAKIDHQATAEINQELWNKFTVLCSLASGTCLMRSDIASIMQSEGGEAFMRALYSECLAVAKAWQQPIPEWAQQMALAALTSRTERLKASMLRDLEAGFAVEAAHIVGDMVHRAQQKGLATPLLQAAWCHLQVYQQARA
ncbi:2-dehydropantoate 2-reductase [Ventosimonas gracilis]|uniref:2-dehydropantoate 2-reductase n=1 Tax=Ventosimonas gracilis TaxID=1680762 RepID=A0A139SRP0_9GAMM|nr:2-dehydropantoate 2-reductase [Ventosimonas gracilis]KXU37207.1 2-dehydropantoate 2-reductase [Ventosimonas gracilis]